MASTTEQAPEVSPAETGADKATTDKASAEKPRLDTTTPLDFAVIDRNYIATERKYLEVQEGFNRGSLATSDDIVAKDEAGNSVFMMDANAGGLDNKRILYDKDGNAIASMTRKLATLHGRWWLYKGTDTDETSPGCIKLGEVTVSIIGGSKFAPKMDFALSDGTHVTVKGGLLAKKFTVYCREPMRIPHLAPRGPDNKLEYYISEKDIEDRKKREAADAEAKAKAKAEAEAAAAAAQAQGLSLEDKDQDGFASATESLHDDVSTDSSDDDDDATVADSLSEEQMASQMSVKRKEAAAKEAAKQEKKQSGLGAKFEAFGQKVTAKLEARAKAKEEKRAAQAKAERERIAALPAEEREAAEKALADKEAAAEAKKAAKAAKLEDKVAKGLADSEEHGRALAFIKKEGTVGTLLEGNLQAVASAKISRANHYFAWIKPGVDTAFITAVVAAVDEIYHDPNAIKMALNIV